MLATMLRAKFAPRTWPRCKSLIIAAVRPRHASGKLGSRILIRLIRGKLALIIPHNAATSAIPNQPTTIAREFGCQFIITAKREVSQTPTDAINKKLNTPSQTAATQYTARIAPFQYLNDNSVATRNLSDSRNITAPAAPILAL